MGTFSILSGMGFTLASLSPFSYQVPKSTLTLDAHSRWTKLIGYQYSQPRIVLHEPNLQHSPLVSTKVRVLLHHNSGRGPLSDDQIILPVLARICWLQLKPLSSISQGRRYIFRVGPSQTCNFQSWGGLLGVQGASSLPLQTRFLIMIPVSEVVRGFGRGTCLDG